VGAAGVPGPDVAHPATTTAIANHRFIPTSTLSLGARFFVHIMQVHRSLTPARSF
jgi:hypothetical protein